MASRLEIVWRGQVVGWILEGEEETVAIELPLIPDEHGEPHLPLSMVKVQGEWKPAPGQATAEFLLGVTGTNLRRVFVLPYSSHMAVFFSLSADGTAWLYCEHTSGERPRRRDAEPSGNEWGWGSLPAK